MLFTNFSQLFTPLAAVHADQELHTHEPSRTPSMWLQTSPLSSFGSTELEPWWLPLVCSRSPLVPLDSGSEEPPPLIFLSHSLSEDAEKAALGGKWDKGEENIRGSKVAERSGKVGMNYSLSAVARRSTPETVMGVSPEGGRRPENIQHMLYLVNK